MQYQNIHLIYFSPTHTSAKIAYAIAEALEADTLSESDITHEGLKELLSMGGNELVIVAVPVYGGRVAETAMDRIRMFKRKRNSGYSCRSLRKPRLRRRFKGVKRCAFRSGIRAGECRCLYR